MNRLCEVLALVGIAAAVVGLCIGLASAEPRLTGSLDQELEWITAKMYEQGLQRRVDVVIEINASEVAKGFSRADCDGLLLIAPLPHTAQGWLHIAPRLDLSGFTVHYIYGGKIQFAPPVLRRLGDRLSAQLRREPASSRPRMVAVAEAGSCGLLASVGGVLSDFSRGGNKDLPGMSQQWALRGVF